jgi:copper chaperone NosL
MSTPHHETRAPQRAAHAYSVTRVRRLGSTLAFLAGLALAGCGGGAAAPPEMVVDRTSCDHCRMLISDVRFAAAFEQPPAAANVFDDIGCLLTAVRNASASGATFWFRDANDGEWIPGAQAVFVSAPGLRTPMSGGIVAYRDAAAAEQAAGREGGTVLRTVTELLESTKAGSGS